MHLFDPWGAGYLPPGYGATATSRGIASVAYTMPARSEFFTWREAVLQAIDTCRRFNVKSKPTVYSEAGRWVVAYTYEPVLMNGDAA